MFLTFCCVVQLFYSYVLGNFMDFLEGIWYLTCWGTHFTFATMFMISLACYLDYRRVKLKKHLSRSKTQEILIKISLILFEITIATEVVITVVFWVFIYEDPGNAVDRANSYM